jgi:hypothetical protein
VKSGLAVSGESHTAGPRKFERKRKMSTRYQVRKELRFAELFDGRLESYRIHEVCGSEDDRWERFRCLTNGRDYVYCYTDEFGFLQ